MLLGSAKWRACLRPRLLLLAAVAAVVFGGGIPLAAQEEGSAPEVLTVEQAVTLALEGNRPLRIVEMEVEKSAEDVAIARTHRLPAFQTYLFGDKLLTPLSFTFKEGAFGTYSIGPIPAADTKITTPRRPNVYALATAGQPLSQL